VKSALIAVTVVVLAGGCTKSAPPPQQALAAAVAKTQATTAKAVFNVVVRGNAELSGQAFHDEAAHATVAQVVDLSADQAGGWETFALGTDLYVKAPTLDPNKYTHIDGKRVKSLTGLGVDPYDPSGIGRFPAAIVSARRGSHGEYTGTVDLAKAAPPGVTQAVLRALGSAAVAQFEATVDAAGHLESLTIHLSGPNFGAGDQTYVNFDSFGTTLDEPLTAPARDLVVEASPQLYSRLRA
jgi:hypothetical protein